MLSKMIMMKSTCSKFHSTINILEQNDKYLKFLEIEENSMVAKNDYSNYILDKELVCCILTK